MKIGALGNIAFEFSQQHSNSIDELKRERTWKYAEHEIIKGKNKLQALGQQLTTVSITGQFVDYFCNPRAEINKFQVEAAKRKPLVLAIGNESFGQFVIEKVSETWSEADADGNPRMIAFEVALKEYN